MPTTKEKADDSSELVRVHLIISGKVQGVYFRKHTQETSIDNHVRGWVKNLDNGNVECILEGTKSNVYNVVEWCHIGPPQGRVDNVQIIQDDNTYTGKFSDFKIL
ncbi:MAG: acylphosphatase [Nitrososphaeraceae archaeon]